MLEKKLDEKYFFVMEKFDFENLSMTFFLGAKIIFGKILFHENFRKKTKIFVKKSDFFTSKMHFFVEQKSAFLK